MSYPSLINIIHENNINERMEVSTETSTMFHDLASAFVRESLWFFDHRSPANIVGALFNFQELIEESKQAKSMANFKIKYKDVILNSVHSNTPSKELRFGFALKYKNLSYYYSISLFIISDVFESLLKKSHYDPNENRIMLAFGPVDIIESNEQNKSHPLSFLDWAQKIQSILEHEYRHAMQHIPIDKKEYLPSKSHYVKGTEIDTDDLTAQNNNRKVHIDQLHSGDPVEFWPVVNSILDEIPDLVRRKYELTNYLKQGNIRDAIKFIFNFKNYNDISDNDILKLRIKELLLLHKAQNQGLFKAYVKEIYKLLLKKYGNVNNNSTK